MIYTWEHFKQDQKLNCDVCIVGSGAGGSAAAAYLAARGHKVILLEAGSFLRPKDFSQKEEEMFPKLFYESGGRRNQEKTVRIMHGHGVGGSTLHNINLCKRAPDDILESWQLETLDRQLLNECYQQVEQDLQVSRLEEQQLNQNNMSFKVGVEKLGLKGGMLSHNRSGCLESGFCELGCAFDAKMNALRVYIPQVVKHGGTVLANTRAIGLTRDKRRITELLAEVQHPNGHSTLAKLTIAAKKFVISAGAIETPLLLQRSEIHDPYELIGSKLHLHPGAVACGVHSHEINMWQGIPQSYECTEFLKFDHATAQSNNHKPDRIWLVAGSAHPIGVAGMLPAFGQEHRELMQLYPHISTITPMLHDSSSGTVQATGEGKLQPKINYRLNQADRQQMSLGLKESAKIVLASGAKEALIPMRQLMRFKTISEIEATKLPLEDFDADYVAVHPMSSVWMGDKEEKAPCTPQGRIHQYDNLFVADTSLFPTSLGVPPQISAYSFGRYVAHNVHSA